MRRWSLTVRFAVLSLLAVVVLGAVVGTVVQRVVTKAATAEAARSGELLAHFADDGLTVASLTNGLTAAQRQRLDRGARPDEQTGQLRNLLIYTPGGNVLYDGKGKLDGRSVPVNEHLAQAIGGHIASEVENDARSEHPELGSLLEVYVPLQLHAADGRHAVLEVYLSYAPTLQRAAAAHPELEVELPTGSGRRVDLVLTGLASARQTVDG